MNKYNPNNIHLANFTGRSENVRKSWLKNKNQTASVRRGRFLWYFTSSD